MLQERTLGVSAVNKNVKTIDAMRLIEALMIRATPGALNKSVEGLKGATLVRQSGPDPIQTSEALHRLMEIGAELQTRLTEIEQQLAR